MDIYKLIIIAVCLLTFVIIISYYTHLDKFRYSLKEKQIVRYKLDKGVFELGRIIRIQVDGVIISDCKTLQTFYVPNKKIYPLKKHCCGDSLS